MNPIQQIAEAEFHIQNTEKYILSISLKADGLSFVILNGQKIVKGEIYEWQAKTWKSATDNFRLIFNKHSFFNSTFSKIIILIKSQECTLVPNKYFDKSKNQVLLETYLGKKNFIAKSQALKLEEVNMIYGISPDLDKLITLQFPKANIFHQSAILIDSALKSATHKETISLSISTQSFEIIGIKDNKLMGHNHFNFQSIDEFMFLLLSFIKQNNFNIEALELKLSGKILMTSKIGENLERFFPNINQIDNGNLTQKEIAFVELKSHTLLANN